MTYEHQTIEKKWSEAWFHSDVYNAVDFSPKKKKYILVEFPYPSGSGLHCGHAFRFTMPDVYARKLRMDGYNVLFPIGWDAFGLPAENYAVKTGVHPAKTTEEAINTYRAQMRMMGYSFDWTREISTIEPGYFKWTQWIFLKFFEAGLAELTEQPVWWCEALKTVLANEEVLDDGKGGKISERGEHPVEKRPLRQWLLKMPEYADKLLQGLDEVDFPESVRMAQSNWIGKSVGAKLTFPLSVTGQNLDVFTTRPDTILGVTFMVLAPEHPLVDALKASISNWNEVDAYRAQTKNRSDLERKAAKEKTGVELKGVTALNPFTPGKPGIPVYIADYVLMEYGTGAIMAVPGHDERDFEFATKFRIPVVQTVKSSQETENDPLPFVSDQGVVMTDKVRTCDEMKEYVITFFSDKKLGERRTTYKLRDWLFSRQRYWGEPIPLIHLEDGSIAALCDVNDKEDVQKKLPLELPAVPDYLPSSDGASPLAKNTEWVTTTDKNGKPAKRETNTMPNWAGSCWYYMRYTDPKNDTAFADPEKLKYWLPVDRYFGGSEHTTLHLLYSRFWHKFLYDQGAVPTSEPYAWRMNGGILLGPDSEKMSKSRGNVVNPDDKVKQYGADALRLYINFMGPYDGTLPWSESGLKACRRLIDRIFDLETKISDTSNGDKLVRDYHKMVKRIGSMFDNLKMNTAVSELMIFVREAEAEPHINLDLYKGLLLCLAPLAPFSAEELWQKINKNERWTPESSIHVQCWPTYDEALARDEVITIGIQINGKLRDQVQIAIEETEASVREKVLAQADTQKWIDGKEVKKFIYVKGRIVNIVC